MRVGIDYGLQILKRLTSIERGMEAFKGRANLLEQQVKEVQKKVYTSVKKEEKEDTSQYRSCNCCNNVGVKYFWVGDMERGEYRLFKRIYNEVEEREENVLIETVEFKENDLFLIWFCSEKTVGGVYKSPDEVIALVNVVLKLNSISYRGVDKATFKLINDKERFIRKIVKECNLPPF